MALWNCWVMHIIKGAASFSKSGGSAPNHLFELAQNISNLYVFVSSSINAQGWIRWSLDAFPSQTKIVIPVDKNWFSIHSMQNTLLGKKHQEIIRDFKEKEKQ